MHPIVIIICLLVVAFLSFFIAYSEEKKEIKRNALRIREFVDDPNVLFDGSFQEQQNIEDIEII